MEYKATLDLKSKIITGSIAILFSVITVYNFSLLNFRKGDSTQTTILILSTLLIVSVFLVCFLLRPIKYVIESNQLIIKRPIKDLIIDFKNIKDAFLPTRESMKWSIRTFGNGGLFGYFGSFRNTTYGGMTWYATKTSNYLMIVTNDNDKIVLTPDDMGMINELKK